MDSEVTVAKLEAVRYDTKTGLVPVVVQDAQNGTVLMLAYANREALKRTLGTQTAWFWSRSRQAYWQKGATSGNTQTVCDVRIDCDGDAVLYLVTPAGPACHTGAQSCFYRTVTHVDDAELRGAVAGDGHGTSARTAGHGPVDAPAPARIADQTGDAALLWPPGSDALQQLWQVLDERYRTRPAGSYTAYLYDHGVDKIAKKVAEEAAEVVIAAKNAVPTASVRRADGQAELTKESADLVFHLLALWRLAGIAPADVFRVLDGRAQG